MAAKLVSALVPPLLVAGALFPLVFVQPAMARSAHGMKESGDVNVLPPPDQLRAMTMGYRDATVDLLWSKLLVDYGTHWQDKRAFPGAPYALDAILALDPYYEPVFRFCDTLLFYHPGGTPTAEDVALVEKYMRLGLQRLPDHGKLWLQYGQFLSFIAISVMPPEKVEAMRIEGAEWMARGVELGAETSRVLTVATLLDHAGARSAAINNLERSYALTDDPTTRQQIATRLAQLHAGAQRDDAERQIKLVEARWASDFDFLTRGEYLMVAPIPDTMACAGVAKASSTACAYDWPTALREDDTPQ